MIIMGQGNDDHQRNQKLDGLLDDLEDCDCLIGEVQAQ
jgi:hypothetical protein